MGLPEMAEVSAPAPALSVVVPVYNGAGTVGELVGALRGLDIEGGLEIVLVVDCSPDNSLDVCKQLAASAVISASTMRSWRDLPEHAAPSPSPWTTTCRIRRAR
jgi:cellulose synthase/poly-beta-1,6-N-acetylglucosamine synthase-like glycosyltransferase